MQDRLWRQDRQDKKLGRYKLKHFTLKTSLLLFCHNPAASSTLLTT